MVDGPSCVSWRQLSLLSSYREISSSASIVLSSTSWSIATCLALKDLMFGRAKTTLRNGPPFWYQEGTPWSSKLMQLTTVHLLLCTTMKLLFHLDLTHWWIEIWTKTHLVSDTHCNITNAQFFFNKVWQTRLGWHLVLVTLTGLFTTSIEQDK